MVEILDRPEQEMVLVVDDTPDNLQLISELLMDRYRVKVANNGAKALRVAQASPAPDLILLDIMMPEMDGYNLVREIRRSVDIAATYVLLHTSLDSTMNTEKARSVGANAVLTKFSSVDLTQALLDAFRQMDGRS